MKLKFAAAALILAAAPALAQEAAVTDIVPTGDAAAGEAAFRQCATCHVVANPAGETLAGRAAKTGPNLYGVAGRVLGKVPDFRYSAALAAAGEKGKVYDEETFVAYLKDPTGFLREFLGDSSARGNMTYKVRKEEDAHNIFAYLHSLSNGEIWPPEAVPAATN